MNDGDSTAPTAAREEPASGAHEWVPRREAVAETVNSLGVAPAEADSLLTDAVEAGAIRESDDHGERVPRPEHGPFRGISLGLPLTTVPALHRLEFTAWLRQQQTRRRQEHVAQLASFVASPPEPTRVHGPPSEPDHKPFWVRGETAIEAVKRRWPGLERKEIDGALRDAVDSNAVRYKRLPPPPPSPPIEGVSVLGGIGPWHTGLRFDEVDVIRWFAEREVRLAGSPPATSEAPPPHSASEPPSSSDWLSLPLACGEVAHATGKSERWAAEWLRGEARARRIRVRYPPASQKSLEVNTDPEAIRSRASCSPDEGRRCAYRWALDDLDLGPQVVEEPRVRAMEWHAPELRARLIEETKLDQTASEPAPGHRTMGRAPAWDWHAITAEAALAVAAARGMEMEPLIELMREAAKRQTGRKPSRSGAQPYARRVLAAWNNAAGNAGK